MPPPRHPVLCSVRLINEQAGEEGKKKAMSRDGSVLGGQFYPPPCRFPFRSTKGRRNGRLRARNLQKHISVSFLRFRRKIRRVYIRRELFDCRVNDVTPIIYHRHDN